jgi:hypothetical protein
LGGVSNLREVRDKPPSNKVVFEVSREANVSCPASLEGNYQPNKVFSLQDISTEIKWNVY